MFPPGCMTAASVSEASKPTVREAPSAAVALRKLRRDILLVIAQASRISAARWIAARMRV